MLLPLVTVPGLLQLIKVDLYKKEKEKKKKKKYIYAMVVYR